jgi:RHS repeat-associated protein
VRLGFTGHERDDDYGLVNMIGRFYDPVLGRFLSPDPIVGIPDSQGLNRLSYVRNNPQRFVDPTGYESTDTLPSETNNYATGSVPNTTSNPQAPEQAACTDAAPCAPTAEGAEIDSGVGEEMVVIGRGKGQAGRGDVGSVGDVSMTAAMDGTGSPEATFAARSPQIEQSATTLRWGQAMQTPLPVAVTAAQPGFKAWQADGLALQMAIIHAHLALIPIRFGWLAKIPGIGPFFARFLATRLGATAAELALIAEGKSIQAGVQALNQAGATQAQVVTTLSQIVANASKELLPVALEGQPGVIVLSGVQFVPGGLTKVVVVAADGVATYGSATTNIVNGALVASKFVPH